MGWEFCSYTTTPDTVHQPQLFAGKETHVPTRFSDALFISENEAVNAMCDVLDKHECKYALFIERDITEPLDSPSVARAHAQFTKHSTRVCTLTLDAIAKAERYQHRTCTACKKPVNMQHYTRLFDRFKDAAADSPCHLYLHGQCPHCADSTLPLTAAQRRDIDKAQRREQRAYDAYTGAQDTAIRAMHKAGKLSTMAVVLGLVHEIEARKYNDEHDSEYDDVE